MTVNDAAQETTQAAASPPAMPALPSGLRHWGWPLVSVQSSPLHAASFRSALRRSARARAFSATLN